MPQSSPTPIDFPMKAEYRRAARWALGGMLLVTIVSGLVGPDLWQAIGCGAVCLGLSVNCVFVDSWRLRVDAKGIARRRFRWWSYWNWEQFQGGHVRPGNHLFEFRCATRPWWDRRLLLDALDDEAARTLNRQLRAMLPRQETVEAGRVYEGAAQGELSDKFVLEILWARRVTLARDGIAVSSKNRDRLLGWNDVDHVRLERFAMDRGFHYRLVVTLTTGEVVAGGVKSVRRNARRIWDSHAATAEWPQQLAWVTPPEKWRIFRTEGELHSVAEASFRQAYWERKERQFYWLAVFGVPLIECLSMLVFIPKMGNAWQAQFIPWWWKPITLTILGLVVVIPGVLLGAICWMGRQRSRAAQQETRDELARLTGASDVPAKDHNANDDLDESA